MIAETDKAEDIITRAREDRPPPSASRSAALSPGFPPSRVPPAPKPGYGRAAGDGGARASGIWVLAGGVAGLSRPKPAPAGSRARSQPRRMNVNLVQSDVT